MRTSLFALAAGGLLAASVLFPAPAEANHRWSPERGWNAGHRSPARVVVAPPRQEVVVVRKVHKHKKRHVVVVHPDGSRSYVVRRPPPRVVYVP